MTGIVTASWIPSMRTGSLMRATPPSRRMSDGHPLERHHRDRASILGDLRLLGVDDVHDHAAAQHLGQAPLDQHRGRFASRHLLVSSYVLASPCVGVYRAPQGATLGGAGFVAARSALA